MRTMTELLGGHPQVALFAALSVGFFLACRAQLGKRPEECIVVGDAIWDHIGARRTDMVSVGVLTGGYGEEELYHAGAFRVYRDRR